MSKIPIYFISCPNNEEYHCVDIDKYLCIDCGAEVVGEEL